ncbi:MAG: alpha-ketoglutarate-dependent dioxygenase AlkB [Oleispira antarctica]|nr:alpha-ketoglutarate-dependent dioxygenase AlkB [Oleispira antarctica]MBQ0791599.1 alpha-ketoglutarate-dependent dioxygenase AlkB [Oleispira antarctica]
MPLFQDLMEPSINQLPYDGEVHYWRRIFSQGDALQYYELLLKQIAWKNDEAIIFGKHIVTKRKVAWYADEPYQYTYSNIHRTALRWTPHLLALKEKVEAKTQQSYNSCLLNLYHTGDEGMAWHSDDERALKAKGSIASLSLGAVRKFAFKHKKTKERLVFELESGDLIEMKGETQSHWLHNVPTTKKIQMPRINLTFRQMEQ